MIVVTTENIPGIKVVEAKGQVFGLIVRSRGKYYVKYRQDRSMS